MDFRILKGEIAHKKGMCAAIAALILLAAALMTGGLRLTYYASGAIRGFVERSALSDIMVMKGWDEKENERLRAWADGRRDIEALELKDFIQESGVLSFPEGSPGLPENVSLAVTDAGGLQNLVFDMGDAPLSVPEGAIALPIGLEQELGVKTGDILYVTNGAQSIPLRVSGFFKDALMGSGGISSKRAIVSKGDMARLLTVAPPEARQTFAGIRLSPGADAFALLSDYQAEGFSIEYSFDKGMIYTTYWATNGIAAVLLCAASVFMILILALCLRFSIVSTVQEDFKTIGVLKALGLRSGQIIRLYLLKYVFIGAVGSAGGGIAGWILSSLLGAPLLREILAPSAVLAALIVAGGSLAVFAAVVLLCLLMLRLMHRLSPVDAIRYGSTGERFTRASPISLCRRARMPSVLFLAISDIFSSARSYTVLSATFLLCTALIIMAVNFRNSLTGAELIRYFGKTQADLYFFPTGENTLDQLNVVVKDFSRDLREKDVPVHTGVDFMYQAQYIDTSGGVGMPVSAAKSARPTALFSLIEGIAPIHADEIAMTTVLLRRYGRQVGDYCDIQLGTEPQPRRMLITASFQAMYNMGELILLSDDFEPQREYMVINSIQPLLYFDESVSVRDKPVLTRRMEESYPELVFTSPQETVEMTVGGLGRKISLSAALLCAVCGAVTFLMAAVYTRLLIYRDTPSIAILKAVGFTRRQISAWQAIRILLLLAASILAGTLTANTAGELFMRAIFGFTGLTHLQFVIRPAQVYAVIPALLAALVLSAVLTGLGKVRGVRIRNMNLE